MYNRVYKHPNENQFGFQKAHSTEHATIQLVDRISNSFEKNLFLYWEFLLIYPKHSTLLMMRS